ncbi:unnamed protein product [Caenorhabditis angaria]|uniref:CUB domain-containing protein n=1 Tax=Caenorhabditis angaria TaxID=860376 RepID=A0A9P1INC3_9PELO|nr:unnamed protein product [Caenorhabditis angaria]
MKPQIIFLGLLLVLGVFGENPSSTVETTIAISTSAVDSTQASTTVASGSSTELFTGSTNTPGSTISSGTDGTTASSAPQDSTTSGIPASTTPAGSTTPPTLPNVTVNYVQFAFSSCDDTQCTYHFDAPKNDQTFLATEEAIIAADQTEFSSIKTIANTNEAAVQKANNEAALRVQSLLDQLNAIQTQLDTINTNIQQIVNKQQDARNRLQYVENFINQINNSPNTCYYQRCLRPTPPPPPTTTTTPAPTTPPSPCVNFTCPTDTDTSKNCQLDAFNKPYCTDCIGNYDGYTHCLQIACSSSGTNFTFNSTAGADTTLYSYGYNSSNPTGSVIPRGSNCQWNLFGNAFTVDNGFKLDCIVNGASINVITKDFTASLTNGMPLWKINAIFNDAVNPRIILTTGTNAISTFCSLPIKQGSSSSASFSRKIQISQKSQGYFGWLLGY